MRTIENAMYALVSRLHRLKGWMLIIWTLLYQAAIVTGAAGTLGFAFVRMLVREGFKVAAVDLRAEPLQALVDELGADRVFPFTVDVGDATAVSECVRDIVGKIGAIAVLVNNGEYTRPSIGAIH